MNLQRIKESLDCYVSDTIGAIRETKQYNDAVKYKFELSLIACVLSGTILEMFLYINSDSPLWGLAWLLPIYALYKNQLKLMQKPINA